MYLGPYGFRYDEDYPDVTAVKRAPYPAGVPVEPGSPLCVICGKRLSPEGIELDFVREAKMLFVTSKQDGNPVLAGWAHPLCGPLMRWPGGKREKAQPEEPT